MPQRPARGWVNGVSPFAAATGSSTAARWLGLGCASNDIMVIMLMRGTQRFLANTDLARDQRRLGFLKLDQQLAEIAALQEADERRRSFLQPDHHILPVLQLAFVEPAADLAEEVVGLGGEIRDDEAAQRQALDKDRVHQQRSAVRTRRQSGFIVVRDQPADRHPCEGVQKREDGVPDLAADILEIDVDALRASRSQAFAEICRAVIESCLEAELLGEVARLLLAARYADDAASPQLGDLPDHGADRAAGGGYDHCL